MFLHTRSVCSRVMPSAPVRGQFAALQRQIADMRGGNAGERRFSVIARAIRTKI